MDLILNDSFWYWITIIFSIFINSLAISLAHKNKHKILKIVLLINIILLFVGINYYANVLAYIYFIILFSRYLYMKYKKRKKGQVYK